MSRLLYLLGCVGLLAARVIRVPAEQPSIQQGLNAAAFGDTVLVADSSYLENIVWPSTDGIVLKSENGPEQAIINGGGNGRTVMFGSSLTRATVLDGFTVCGGKTNSGAGIMISSGSPSILNCIIENNTCRGGRDYGGGIFIGSNCSPLIRGNVIRNNTCSDTNTWNYGGGVYVDMNSRAEISYNLITGNTCSQGYWNYGAGIYVGLRGMPVICQNIIAGNQNTLGDRGHGAGIYADIQSTPVLFNNLITGNTCASGLWNYGAGIVAQCAALIVNNTIAGNSLNGGNWRSGGGIYLDSQAVAANNIVVNNNAASGGGIFNNRGSTTQLSYNDVWSNSGGDYANCTPGPGSISQDPKFVSGAHGQYYLSQTAAGQPVQSPCVDAGTGSPLPESLQYYLEQWTTRTDSMPDVRPFDMGYHYPQVFYVGTSERPRNAPAPAATSEPNPFVGSVRFASAGQPITSVRVFDAAGRCIAELRPAAGTDAVEWRPIGIAPGTYFFRLAAGSDVQVGRVVKAR